MFGANRPLCFTSVVGASQCAGGLIAGCMYYRCSAGELASPASPNGQYFCHRLISSDSHGQKQLLQIRTGPRAPGLAIASAGTPGGAARAGHLQGLEFSAGALLRGDLAVMHKKKSLLCASPRS
jgi:hypothetical protein